MAIEPIRNVSAVVVTMKRARDAAFAAWLSHMRLPAHLHDQRHKERDVMLWGLYVDAQTALNVEEETRQQFAQALAMRVSP
jgi:hypothetical protein